MAAVGDVYEAVFLQRLHGQEIRNVFHYQLLAIAGGANSPDTDAANSLSVGMESFWNIWRLNASVELTCYGIITQRVRPLPRTAGWVRVPATQAAQVTGESLPSSVAVVIRKRTLYAGRAYRGRTYFAGIPVQQEANSSMSAAAVTAWNTVVLEIAKVITPAAVNGFTFTWTPVLYAKKTALTNQIQSCSQDTILRNQRRRQVGKGV